MAEKIIMPKQGLQMTEGTIIKWLAKEGDPVVEGKPLFEMETDKLTITMDSTATGTLLKIIHGEGDVVPITETIAVVGQPGEDISSYTHTQEAAGSAAADHSLAAASTAAENAPAAGMDFDVTVIGGGPGGYVAAIRCAQYGLKTALVESREMGGTCLNRGCIPTKALLHSAETYEEIVKSGNELGMIIDKAEVNYAKVANRKKAIVKRMSGGVEKLVKARKITLIREKAVLTGKNSYKAGDKEYTTQKIILATGSEPVRIPIPGIDKENVMNSDGVLALEKLPESIVIIGGGVIGIEFATLYCSYGKQVTIIEALPRILNNMDADAAAAMKSILESKGCEIYTGAKVVEIRDGMEVIYEESGAQKSAKGELVVVAIGRRPVTADLNLAAAGVQATEKGFINVNDKLETNVPNIYAIGDITGKIQLAHVASAQGLIAAANVAGKDKKMSYDIVPSCIYSNPEIAAVGLTEEEAASKGLAVKTGVFQSAGNGRSVILGCQEGFVKLVTEERTGEILGATIVAPHATDMIAEIAVAMKAEATVEEIADTIHPHPTVSEMIMEAVHDVEKLSVHKF